MTYQYGKNPETGWEPLPLNPEDGGLEVHVVNGGSGGGGPVTVADGADAAQGATTDPDTANTVVGRLKRLVTLLSGTLAVSIQNATLAVTQSGAWTAARNWTLSSSTDSVNVGNLPATQAVTGPLTDTQLRAAAVPVGQSGTWTMQPGNTPNTTPWLVKSAIDNALQNVLVAWEEMAGTAAAESALTNATFRTENYTALAAGSSYTVPTGKRLRITNVSCYVKATSTVNNLARFRLRAVSSGSVTNASPPVFDTVLALDAPGTVAAGLLKEEAFAIPEGSLDFAAGAQIAFTWNTAANTCTVGLSFVGYLYTP